MDDFFVVFHSHVHFRIEKKMTQPEHTPGPWRLDESTGNIYGADDYPVACDVLEKNTAIIEAAPELLEALESAVNFYVSRVTTPHLGEACANGFPLPENIDWPPYVIKAHSAIVKVRGPQ